MGAGEQSGRGRGGDSEEGECVGDSEEGECVESIDGSVVGRKRHGEVA